MPFCHNVHSLYYSSSAVNSTLHWFFFTLLRMYKQKVFFTCMRGKNIINTSHSSIQCKVVRYNTEHFVHQKSLDCIGVPT